MEVLSTNYRSTKLFSTIVRSLVLCLKFYMHSTLLSATYCSQSSRDDVFPVSCSDELSFYSDCLRFLCTNTGLTVAFCSFTPRCNTRGHVGNTNSKHENVGCIDRKTNFVFLAARTRRKFLFSVTTQSITPV